MFYLWLFFNLQITSAYTDLSKLLLKTAMKQDLVDLLSDNCNFAVKYYTFKYKQMPDSRAYNVELDQDLFKSEIQKIYPTIENISQNRRFYIEDPKTEWKPDSGSLFLDVKERMVIHYEGNTFVLSVGNEIEKEEVETIERLLLKSQIKHKKTSHQFSMINKQDFGSYELTEFKIKKLELNIDENYNEDLVKINPSIINFLNSTDETGIILFHGIPGTGKTTYIRSLISNCSTRFIYMPNNIVQCISQPEFISFISSFPGSVLVLEDCEELVKLRGQNETNSGIANLLSLGDGLLGDALKIKIICTFNCELKKIDKALLRKGRLKYRYEFLPLTSEKSNNLFRKLNIISINKDPLTIAEIYNFTNENSTLHEEKAIGFMA